MRDHVLPGNKEFIEGDTIPRPPRRRRRRRLGGQPRRRRRGRFPLRPVAGGVPRSVPRRPGTARPRQAARWPACESPAWRRAGYSVVGLAGQPRAHAHHAQQPVPPHRAEAAEAGRDRTALEARDRRRWRSAGGDRRPLAALRDELAAAARSAAAAIPYIDPIDLRYRRFEPMPRPVAQAVMFCLMDVSGSMTEHMKDLAKRFYMLLYIFLKRRYRHVEIVFIRHTHQAAGGGRGDVLPLPPRPAARWSRPRSRRWRGSSPSATARRTGTSTPPRPRTATTPPSDNAKTAALLTDAILPVCQYFAYLEVGPRGRALLARASCRRAERPVARPTSAIARRRAAASPCARCATGATSSRCSASCSSARRDGRGPASR